MTRQMGDYIIAIDQSTSATKAMLFNDRCEMLQRVNVEHHQYYPKAGWVEHDAEEIYANVIAAVKQLMKDADMEASYSMAITNQRETVVVWDKTTGHPVCNAVVWQCMRGVDICNELKAQGYGPMVMEKSGLLIDPYFSASGVKWILDNVPGAREKAEAGKLRFGNVDTWLIWQLTRGTVHATDVTNASRTMLFNINTLKWDEDMLRFLDIPASMLPEVKSCSEIFGYTKTTIFAHEVPIAGVAGDQQAALFGQMCTKPGSIKNTYGTGCFVMLNTGDSPVISKNNLLTTVAWKIGDTVNYALEGSIYVGGSVVQWLRDGLGIIKSSAEVEELAASVPDSGGVYFVPALTGLAAPYWDQHARGTIVGITRGTTAAHIARAALDGIAFQTYDIAQAMANDLGKPLVELKVDGGASRNALLMQRQADLLGIKVIRPITTETTAEGVAFMAGLAVGYWSGLDEIKNLWLKDVEFTPSSDSESIERDKEGWKNAINRTLS